MLVSFLTAFALGLAFAIVIAVFFGVVSSFRHTAEDI